MRYDGTNLEEVLEEHKRYLCSYKNQDPVEHLRADFSNMIIPNKNFIHNDLTGANFEGAMINGCKFLNSYINSANFKNCILVGVKFIESDIGYANFTNAHLEHVLFGFSLCEKTDFSGAKMLDIKVVDTDMAGAINPPFVPLACPEEGSFIGWKSCTSKGGKVIVKLLIPENAKRSSATGRKCRANKAVVLDIQTIDGKHYSGVAYSIFKMTNTDKDFEYHIGETVEPEEPFDEDRFEECASGIHFFITRQEAVDY